MRQKVSIAIALAENADAMLLDDSAAGLDPEAANDFMQVCGRRAPRALQYS
jgi:ABC-2 type transport system ATP-binding protein